MQGERKIVAAALYGGLAFVADYRTALKIALASIVLVGLAQAVRDRLASRFQGHTNSGDVRWRNGGVVRRCDARSETRRPILTWRSVGIYRLDALILRHRLLGDHLMLSVARHAAFSAGFTRFLAAPFVSGALQVRRSDRPCGQFLAASSGPSTQNRVPLYPYVLTSPDHSGRWTASCPAATGCNRCAAMSRTSQQ